MQKWEYMFLQIQGDGKDHVVQFSQNGETWRKPATKDQTITDLLNYYGTQGWELVHVDGSYWFFKRAHD